MEVMIGSEMEVVVIDGQGGGIGRSVIEALKKEVSGTFIIAVGTNSTATNNMKKGGADAVATGENAIDLVTPPHYKQLAVSFYEGLEVF